ncbi:hypothetical protein EZV62_015215 [Acer yangbiense]|uniref:Protein FAR1-RELATED SEQUENCE n=1 Tax=Acer yangbiense TaxID=1000413 RepID=A0A5C7HWV8_9ROSI|nr:hypothetical protein EZV62_015215 [Acer yangbiense]
MNADEIIKLCDGLMIKEKKGPARTLDVSLKKMSENRLAMSLVGKVLKKKLINNEVFISVMNKIWRVNGGVQIKPVEGNIFVFYFSNLEDRQRILKGGPWTFDRATIVFDKPASAGEIQQMKFQLVDFWVQIHNLLLLCFTEEIGSFLGSMIGEVHDMDLVARSDGSSRFLRVRVTIKVDRPLKRCLLVDFLGDGIVTTMLLRYERLMGYCFRCDKLGHMLDECTVELEEEREVSSATSRKLAVWLRASSPPKRSFRGLGRQELGNGDSLKVLGVTNRRCMITDGGWKILEGKRRFLQLTSMTVTVLCKWRWVPQPNRAGSGEVKFGENLGKRRSVELGIEEGKRSRLDSVMSNEEALATFDRNMGFSQSLAVLLESEGYREGHSLVAETKCSEAVELVGVNEIEDEKNIVQKLDEVVTHSRVSLASMKEVLKFVLYILEPHSLPKFQSSKRYTGSGLTKINMSHRLFTNGTTHLDFNNEGHSRWHEADTTQTLNEEYNPNDTYNNIDCKFHVPFAEGHVSTTPVMFDYNLVQPTDDLLYSELVSLQATDIMGKEFISVTDAEEFYKKYSYRMGFSMRKDRVSRDTYGLITIRRWVCSKEGYRSKKNVDRTDRVWEPRGQTREGCWASFRINLERDKMLWVVKKFVTKHSNILSPRNHSQFLCSHRNVKDSDLAQVQSLRSVGMKTSQVMDQLVEQSGSYAAVGHTGKDLQNRFDTIRRSASHNSNADSIISYMTAKLEMDQRFFFRYTIMEDGSIVTDGDRAMGKAISLVMPSAVHRLCSWHLERNAQTNSTQRSESINYFLNRFLYRRLKLYEFINHIDKAMSRLRNNEMNDDFDTINEHPVLVTHLLQLEKHAAEVYTRNTFAWVRDEIKSEAKLSILNCVDDMDSVMYTFKTFAVGDKTWKVRYTPFTNNFKCSCKMFQTMGIPCCHAFSVMKAMNQHHIPARLIMQRWTKNAKDVSELDSSYTITTPNVMQLARYGALSSKCSKMSYFASMSTEGYKAANVAIDKLTIQMKGLLPLSSTSREENIHQSKTKSSVQVKNPVVAATKGSIKQKTKSCGKARKCGNCG